jgi:hypothetical protein
MGNRVAIIRADGEVLELNNDIVYQTDVLGLFDIPAPDMTGAQGYQGRNVFLSATAGPRQLVLNIHILAGLYLGYTQNINPEHLAARDDLVRFLPYGEEFTLRTPYPGTAGYWDITCVSMGVQWIVDTPDYTCPCTAFDPYFTQTSEQTNHHSLSPTVQELTYTVTPDSDKVGNSPAYPVIQITPLAAKSDRWSRARIYSVYNPSSKNLRSYPIAVNFDFAWHITNGLVLPSGADLLALYQNQLVDFWLGNFPNSAGTIWITVDINAGETQQIAILYSNPEATAYIPATLGPMLNLAASTNNIWQWRGGFQDIPGVNTSRSQQWSTHVAQNQGMAPIQYHLTTPFDQRLADSVNAAGGYIPGASNIQGYAGLAFHHPLGFTAVAFRGYTRTDTSVLKFALRARDPITGALIDMWTQDTNTASVLTAFPDIPGTDISIGFASPQEAIVFALRSLSVHSSIAGYMGAVDRVSATIANPPVVTGASSGTSNEETVYMLEFEIVNNTTGQAILLRGVVTLDTGVTWNSVIVDTFNQIVTMAGENFYPALTTNLPIRTEWLRMLAGANSIYISDPGTNGLDVDLFWHARRL